MKSIENEKQLILLKKSTNLNILHYLLLFLQDMMKVELPKVYKVFFFNDFIFYKKLIINYICKKLN